MPGSISEHGMETIDPSEVRLAAALVKTGLIGKEVIAEFIASRKKRDADGKKYLGDILVEKGFVKREDVEEFFTENNQLYLNFCDKLVEDGYLSGDNHFRIMSDPKSKVNVVSLMEDLGIMTKESFTKLFAKRVNALRLGDWLVAKRRIGAALITQALEEQKIYRLDDYLVFHKILQKEQLESFKIKAGLG